MLQDALEVWNECRKGARRDGCLLVLLGVLTVGVCLINITTGRRRLLRLAQEFNHKWNAKLMGKGLRVALDLFKDKDVLPPTYLTTKFVPLYITYRQEGSEELLDAEKLTLRDVPNVNGKYVAAPRRRGMGTQMVRVE